MTFSPNSPEVIEFNDLSDIDEPLTRFIEEALQTIRADVTQGPTRNEELQQFFEQVPEVEIFGLGGGLTLGDDSCIYYDAGTGLYHDLSAVRIVHPKRQ